MLAIAIISRDRQTLLNNKILKFFRLLNASLDAKFAA